MQTSRLQQSFIQAKNKQDRAVIPYLTAGFPSLAETVPLLHALADAGATVIELGVPFSDPMADGAVIQKAHEMALRNGASLKFVLDCVREFRVKNQATPIVLMGYANPMMHMGLQKFAKTAQEVGVDGVLTVDLPPEEADEYLAEFKIHQIAPVFLISPTSTDRRIEQVCDIVKHSASTFVYYVSLKGVTGAQTEQPENTAQQSNQTQSLQRITDIRARLAAVKTPLVVGFGIKTPADAQKFDQVSDAVVIGSELIRLLDKTPAAQRKQCAGQFIQSFL